MEIDSDYSTDFEDSIYFSSEELQKIKDVAFAVDQIISAVLEAPIEDRPAMFNDVFKMLAGRTVPVSQLPLEFFQTKLLLKVQKIAAQVCQAFEQNEKPIKEIQQIFENAFTPFPLSVRSPPKDWEFVSFVPPGMSYPKTLEELIPLVNACRDRILRATNWAKEYILENQKTIMIPELTPIKDGISGSYLWDGKYVLKPLDEDISHLNNPKGFGSPFNASFMGHEMYSSVFRELSVSEIARITDLDSVAPRTKLGLFQCDAFFDISQKIPGLDPLPKEKLCSAMEFVPDAKSLFETLQEFQMAGLSDKEIMAKFDQDDIEDACILLAITGEKDGHGGNFLTYLKSNGLLGIKKIDNGLSFPTTKGSVYNALKFLPNAKLPLSEKGREKILNLNSQQIESILSKNCLQNSIPATLARIAKLQETVLNPLVTLKQL